MSYTPNTWAAGDTVTAAKLNNLEQGVANAGEVTILDGEYDSNTGVSTLSATAASIWQAYQNGIVLIRIIDESYTQLYIITDAAYNSAPQEGDTRYRFATMNTSFKADSDNEYPNSGMVY